jgi:hypothetical protein
MLGFHGGGSSVIAHNAYYAPPPTSTWKCTVGSAGDSHPVSINLWDGYTTFSNTDPSATLSENSTITWKTTMQICNTGNVGIGKEYAGSRLVVKGEDHSSSHSALNVTDDTDASLLFVRNDGVVKVGTLAGTDDRFLYVNSDGELTAGSSYGTFGWSMSGNTLYDTSLYFVGTVNKSPLIFKTNENEAMRINSAGQVYVGGAFQRDDVNKDFKFAVNGKILMQEARVKVSNWSDYVFEQDYQLLSLEEVEQHIQKNRHLPGVPSEKEVVENGIELGAMQAKLMEKVEELTLYMIQLKKDNIELKNKLTTLQQQISERK